MNYSRPLAPRTPVSSRYTHTQNQSRNGQSEEVPLQAVPATRTRALTAPPPPVVGPYRGVRGTTPSTPVAPPRARVAPPPPVAPYVPTTVPPRVPSTTPYTPNTVTPYVPVTALPTVTSTPVTPVLEEPTGGWLRNHWKLGLVSALLVTGTIVSATVGTLTHKSHGGSGNGAGGNNGTTVTPWLFVNGTHVFQAPASWNGIGTPPNGTLWRGRGANIQDTRSCGVCPTDLPVTEVQRRIDALAGYGINLMRLTLESNSVDTDLMQDPQYFSEVQEIVNYIGTKPNMYAEVSLWIDPTFTDMGWPSPQTDAILAKLAQTFANDSHVFFGVCNEPKHNNNGANDTLVWTAMNNAVSAIRAQEEAQNSPQHMVAVQGTRNWGQDLSYYVTHPIEANNGSNVLYEVHVYDSQDNFQTQIFNPAAQIPVIIGEYGPASQLNEGTQTVADSIVLMQQARNANIPHIAWNFHMNCGPNLLVNNLTPDNPCGIGVPLQLSPQWGQQWQQGMAEPWT